MAEAIISPGVFQIESDQSLYTTAPQALGAAIVGPTVGGRPFVPTYVTSYNEYVSKFGESFKSGSNGTIDLARAVKQACQQPASYFPLYPLDMPVVEKLATIVREVYGGEGVELLPLARRRIEHFERWGFKDLPVCIAKTQYSLSHDPKLLGRPRGFRLPIRDCRLAAGAGRT